MPAGVLACSLTVQVARAGNELRANNQACVVTAGRSIKIRVAITMPQSRLVAAARYLDCRNARAGATPPAVAVGTANDHRRCDQQRQTERARFGHGRGIDFKSDRPTTLDRSAITVREILDVKPPIPIGIFGEKRKKRRPDVRHGEERPARTPWSIRKPLVYNDH